MVSLPYPTSKEPEKTRPSCDASLATMKRDATPRRLQIIEATEYKLQKQLETNSLLQDLPHPPGFAKKLTEAQEHRSNLQWWVDKREECRQNWLDKREEQLTAPSEAKDQFLAERPTFQEETPRATRAQPCWDTLRHRLFFLKKFPRRTLFLRLPPAPPPPPPPP